jgi:psiF repeat
MKQLMAVLSCLTLAVSPLAFAQDKKAPSEAQQKQQELMRDCNAKAAGKKGDERRQFMAACLKGGDGKMTAQQAKMVACNKEARGKKGDERRKFLSGCLKDK